MDGLGESRALDEPGDEPWTKRSSDETSALQQSTGSNNQSINQSNIGKAAELLLLMVGSRIAHRGWRREKKMDVKKEQQPKNENETRKCVHSSDATTESTPAPHRLWPFKCMFYSLS
jgi:hypothetical protein